MQEDCSAEASQASQPVEGGGCKSLLRRILSSRSLSLSSSSFLSAPFAPTSSSSSPFRPFSFRAPAYLPFRLSHSFSVPHIHTNAHGQTFCLLPLALTIKRWRRLARATMFLIPLSVSPLTPSPQRFPPGCPRSRGKST